MNLIRPDIWDYELPWGNLPEPRICTALPQNVKITDKIEMFVRKEVQRGWWRDSKWELHECLTDYSGGMLVSKERLGYGHFRMTARVPGWRGSWPAFWLIDTSGEMGVPPEVDIMEHMVKDSCLTKYRSTCSYHDKPEVKGTYSKETCQTNWERRKVSDEFHVWEFDWQPDRMIWYVDGRVVMTVMKSQCRRFPDHEMNILLDLTVGDWKTKDHEEPFIITELSYY